MFLSKSKHRSWQVTLLFRSYLYQKRDEPTGSPLFLIESYIAFILKTALFPPLSAPFLQNILKNIWIIQIKVVFLHAKIVKRR